MKRPPIAFIRRVVLVALVAVVALLLGTYGFRRWRAQQARESVPESVPGDVRQQAERFTFSRSEGGQTLFKVEAQRTTERAGKTTVLEDVFITIYGIRGERADEIRTARCEYDVEGTGQIICPGEVVVHLRGGRAGIADYQRAVILTTAAVHFDPSTSVAWTDQPVRFEFPNGRGQALGLRYQSEEPALRFERDVTVELAGARAPIVIRGAALRFFARAPAFELVPPLEIRAGEELLTAASLRLELDSTLQARRIEAAGNVRARRHTWGRLANIRADRAAADYRAGRLERLRAAGQVVFEQEAAGAKEQLFCDEAVFSFDAAGREVERVTATGNARLLSASAGQARELRAPSMELRLRAAEQVLTARPNPALVLRGAAGDAQTIAADEMRMQFEARQRLRTLVATGSVQARQTRPGASTQATSSHHLRLRFDDAGRLADAEQWGAFRYQSDAWKAEAGRAVYSAAGGVYVLRESPAVWDAQTRTTAREIQLDDRAGLIRAEGEVRTTYTASADSPGFGPGEPAHLASERLRAERAAGRALYTGKARLWQGENRLAADSIELTRAPRRLLAEGNVSGHFLDATAPDGARAVQVASPRFAYAEADRRGLFDGGVVARNDFGTVHAPQLEVFLARSGAARLERALARGGVLIEGDGAEATGEQAEYRAAARTVAVWGGAPKISDPARGTTAGDRLTLFLADGTIRIESAEGTRTFTRRPWTR
jgi:lipopolysaccharide export system protein LptA